MTNWLRKWRRPDHHWPKYLPGGRLRTSTAALVIAFAGLSWLYQTYEPPAPDPTPETAIVPPGFVPDPNYTWVPRTNVRTGDPSSTTPTSPTESTSPGETTSPTSPSESPGSGPTRGDGSGSPSSPTPSTKPDEATTSAGPETPTTSPPR